MRLMISLLLAVCVLPANCSADCITKAEAKHVLKKYFETEKYSLECAFANLSQPEKAEMGNGIANKIREDVTVSEKGDTITRTLQGYEVTVCDVHDDPKEEVDGFLITISCTGHVELHELAD